MPELVAAILGSLIRHGLTLFFGWLALHGWVDPSEAIKFAVGGTGLVLTVLWSLWNKYKSRVLTLTALEMPAGSSEESLHRAVEMGKGITGRSALGLVLAAALAGPALLGCALFRAPASVTTPQGRAAFTADQVALQIGHLEQAVIQANTATPKGLPDLTAVDLVKFCVAAEQTLAVTPAGWQQALSTAWAQTKASLLPPVTNPIIVSLMGAVDVALASLGGQ